MSIQIRNGNPLSFTLSGDGTTTVFTLDVTQLPVANSFNGQTPSGIFQADWSGTGTMTATLSHKYLTLTFSVAPSTGQAGQADIYFYFPGV